LIVISRRAVLLGAAVAPIVRFPRKIRVALIGSEGHTEEILKPLKDLPDVQLVGTCGKKVQGIKEYPDYRSLLDTEKPDIAAICNNNGERARVILDALDRKMHVIAEKPLALTLDDLVKIRHSVSSNKLRIGMLLPMRYDPEYLALKDIVSKGLIGEVAQIASQKSYKAGKRDAWYLSRSTYGGSIAWIGIHMIDLMRWTSGREFASVMGMHGHVGFPQLKEMENVTASIFKLDNGGVASLRMDYLRTENATSHGDDRLRLAGTKGVVEYQAATGVTLMTTDQPPHVVTKLPPQGSLFTDWLNDVYNGKPAMISEPDIYRVTEITIGAQEAADKGTVVQWER